MELEKLNKWADLLLDTGRGNNLINFKDSKSMTAEVVAPNSSIFFDKAEHASRFEVFDAFLGNEGDKYFSVDLELDEQGNKKQLTKEEYLKKYLPKLPKQQLLFYNVINKPEQALKNIKKKAQTVLEETGVNTAYLAFGFVHWSEVDAPNDIMRAPLLLKSITIENESTIEPFYIKVIDDEIIVNPTFSFKLQNEYNVTLPEFDEDEGYEAYLKKIEQTVAKLNWTVSNECKIGIFSFLKINMYRDLKDNAQKIVESNSVRVLLGEAGAESQLNSKSDPSNNLLNLHNVVDADSSQAEAIQFAKDGKSFILQGPPGTGKSQTITNIIAECLMAGKKVLFVSEKLAALNVVYNKLKNVGLEEFCLELHSHKANKRQVIEELCHTLKLPKSGISNQADKELKVKNDAQAQLDSYNSELHAVHPVINKSLYDLYENVSLCRSAPQLDFVISNIESKGEEYFDTAQTLLKRYVDYVPSVGYNYKQNIWHGYVNTDYSYQTVMQLKSDLQDAIVFYKHLLDITSELKDKYELNLESIYQINLFKKFLNMLKESKFVTPALLELNANQLPIQDVESMQILANEILALKQVIDNNYDADIYSVDGKKYHKQLTKQFNKFFSRLFNKEYKKIITDIRLCKKDGKKPKYNFALEIMNNLKDFQQKTQEFNKLQNNIKKYLSTEYNGINTNYAVWLNELNNLKAFKIEGINYANLAKLTPNEFLLEKDYLINISNKINILIEENLQNQNRLIDNFDNNLYDIERVKLCDLKLKLENCLKNINKLDNWCEFTKFLHKLESLELKDFVDFAIKQNVKTQEIVMAFNRAFYSQWIYLLLQKSPTLLELTRIPHDEIIDVFCQKDILTFEINKAKIKAKLSNLRPSLDMVAQGSSVAILLRESEKKRKQKGVRQLLSEIGELAMELKPCFLMSPLSVSTYLSPDMNFDLVVFDEASQIFPQDAIVAIYRGKQLIVVGDSKQMPPTNFFNDIVDVENNDMSDDVTDFESILDLCSATFPQRRLKWHYRSRYEELISFSNKHFYDNELVTFPCAKTAKQDAGVEYFHVDGVFDRKSKTNLAEAEKVVDLVYENIKKYPNRSLGVVAFSISQQNLIDRVLTKRRRQDPSLEIYFKSDREEPFFIKNLETVQGDERDVIIFSTAYAKDCDGKLLLNFGPLNRDGGERRLNVAITRAKQNVKLVTSLHGIDIDLSRTKSVGARLLRNYLDYAENQELALTNNATDSLFENAESQMAKGIQEFLQQNGYVVDTNLGYSALKIDLAIKLAGQEDYVLAIECDGLPYYNSKTVRDRDRLRKANLERMGWKFYRMWSPDWFKNKAVEKERLLALLEEVKQESKSQQKSQEQELKKDITFEEELEVAHFEFPKYVMATGIPQKILNTNNEILKTVHKIVQVESPISEEWLLKRIVYMFEGRQKVTSVVRNKFEKIMQNCAYYGISRSDGFLYLDGQNIPLLRVPAKGEPAREVKYIEPYELARGMNMLLKQNVNAQKSGLFKLLVQQLGYARLNPSMEEYFEKALKLLDGIIDVDGDMLSIK